MKNQTETETIPVQIIYCKMDSHITHQVTFDVTLPEDAPITDFVDAASEMLDGHIAQHHADMQDYEILDIA